MRYLKMLGLAAVAAMAVMAFVGAGTASAAGVLCSTATDPCTSRWAVGTEINFSLKSGTSAKLINTEGTLTINTCKESTIKGKLTKNEAGGDATSENSLVSWAGCTWTTETIKPGKLRFSAGGSGPGTLIFDEEIKERFNTEGFLGHCEYGVASGTTLGTVTEGIGAVVVFKLNAVAKRLGGTNCIAPETTRWTGEYLLASPPNTT